MTGVFSAAAGCAGSEGAQRPAHPARRLYVPVTRKVSDKNVTRADDRCAR